MSQNSPNTSNARIVVKFLLTLPSLKLSRSHIFLGTVLGIGHHRTQLEDVNLLPALPDTLLPEEGFARRINAYR
jgi:hypothetical protein